METSETANDRCIYCGAGPDVPGGLSLRQRDDVDDRGVWRCRRFQECERRADAHENDDPAAVVGSGGFVSTARYAAGIDADYAERQARARRARARAAR